MSLDSMTPQQRQLIERTGALLKGHFVLASGLHSEYYFQCALLCQFPKVMDVICGELATRTARAAEVETVISPAIGGIVFGQELARAIARVHGTECRAIFAEKQDDTMVLRRGFALRRGEKVLLAEDVTTTGGSVLKVEHVAREAGAEVLGFSAIVDRSGGAFHPSAPFEAWTRLHFPTYAADALPDSLRAMPVQKPGSGRK